jgi:signal transduction histidine kinase
MSSHNTEVIVFLVAANLIVAGLAIFFFFVLRIQHKRKILHRQQLLAKEFKTREDTIRNISRDLHDEIGSSLSGINLFTQMAEQQLRDKNLPAAEEFLLTIKGYTEMVIEKTGDLVWMLQPENDTMEKMLQRLQSFGESVTRARSIQFTFTIASGFFLPVDELLFRKNIYLICKEAINNAVKYSDCRTLSIECKGNTILITDNGKGFDKTRISQGQGIQNMQQRAAESGISIALDSGLDRSTAVKLVLR